MEIAGHPADLFEPARGSEFGYTVLYLHGVRSNRLTDNPIFTDLFDCLGLRVICPIAGATWWTNRISPDFDREITAETHLVKNVLPYIEARWGSAPPRIALLGTSMGGQGALRLAFKFPNVFPVVAALAPAIDYHKRLEDGDPVLRRMYPNAEAARQETAILHVHPLNWPRNIWFACDPTDDRWYDSSERLRMKLFSLGIPHVCELETVAGGHGFQYYDQMAPTALNFIVARLENERLRSVERR